MSQLSNPTDTPRPKSINKLWLAGLAILALATGLLFGWSAIRLAAFRLFGPPDFHGLVIQSPYPVTNFTLTTHTGEPMSLADFRGKLVLIYFGYTYCPDECPATLAELAQMRRLLDPAEQEQVQVIMISVDPERDTPAQLASYLAHFDDSFIGMTGRPSELVAATTPLGVFYDVDEGAADASYLVAHTGTISVIDRQGHLRLVYPADTTGEVLAEDVRYVMWD